MSDTMLNVSYLKAATHANGPGIRAAVWVQGCNIGCNGCYNPSTHAHEPNRLLSPKEIADWYCSLPGVEGITFSGGEPFEQAKAVLEVIKEIDQSTVEMVNVFIYSGYTLKQLKSDSNKSVKSLLERIDILSSGPFIKELMDKNLLWRGSSNQELHFLSERFNELMMEKWKWESPVEEITLSIDGVRYTGFGGPRSNLVRMAKSIFTSDF